jgi:hypothetical protein
VNPRLAAAAVLALLVAPSTPALALGAVVTSPPGASTAVSVREAVSASGGTTVRWGSVEIRGTASTVAWLVPARQGAALDLASDAWLEALEAASAPRVVPPDVTPPCGIPGGVEVEGDFTHTVTAAPGTVAVAQDRPSLDAALAGFGLSVTSDLAPSVDAAFSAGSAIVALVYSDVPTDLITRTVRIVDTSPATFPLALLEAGAAPVSITAFAFGNGSVAVGELPPLSMNAAAVLWLSDGTSSYPSARDGLLAASPGAWLFETGGHDVVFDGMPVPGGTWTPALTTSYFFRAASYADATDAPDGCTNDANAVAQSNSTVATACPQGSLARIGNGPATCQEIVGAGEIDPAALRCGGISDDLAMALSGLTPARTWITRVRGSLAAWTTGQDDSLAPATAAGPYGPVVTAAGYAEPCAATSTSSGGTGTSNPGQAGPSSSGGPGSGGTGGSGDPGGGGGGGGVIVAVSAAQTAGAVADSSEGCGGDSSDSSDSCDSDSSDADDAGGCGGSADDGGGCDVATHRRGYASRVAMLLVALATLTRRRQRPS